MASHLSISRAWDEAKARIAADGKLFVAVALALIALPHAIVMTIAPPPQISGVEPSGLTTILSFLVFVVRLTGQIALVRLALGPASVAEGISHGLRRVSWTFLAFLILMIGAIVLSIPVTMLIGIEELQAVATGGQPDPSAAGYVLLFMVALLLIFVRFQIFIPVATAEPIGPIAILKRSWDLTRGHYWKLLGFLVAALVVAIVLLLVPSLIAVTLLQMIVDSAGPMSAGAMILGLISGLFLAAFNIGVFVILARIYAQLTGGSDVLEPSVPSSGT